MMNNWFNRFTLDKLDIYQPYLPPLSNRLLTNQSTKETSPVNKQHKKKTITMAKFFYLIPQVTI